MKLPGAPKRPLFAARFVNHILQAINVLHDQFSGPLLKDSEFRKTIDFTRNRFAMCADAAGDFGVGWDGPDAHGTALWWKEPCEPEKFGACTICDV